MDLANEGLTDFTIGAGQFAASENIDELRLGPITDGLVAYYLADTDLLQVYAVGLVPPADPDANIWDNGAVVMLLLEFASEAGSKAGFELLSPGWAGSTPQPGMHTVGDESLLTTSVYTTSDGREFRDTTMTYRQGTIVAVVDAYGPASSAPSAAVVQRLAAASSEKLNASPANGDETSTSVARFSEFGALGTFDAYVLRNGAIQPPYWYNAADSEYWQRRWRSHGIDEIYQYTIWMPAAGSASTTMIDVQIAQADSISSAHTWFLWQPSGIRASNATDVQSIGGLPDWGDDRAAYSYVTDWWPNDGAEKRIKILIREGDSVVDFTFASINDFSLEEIYPLVEAQAACLAEGCPAMVAPMPVAIARIARNDVKPVSSSTVTPTATPTPISSASATPFNLTHAFAITSHDIYFEPNELTIPADTEVVIHLPNEGAAPHSFVIPNLGIRVEQASGTEEEITLNAPVGEYDFICDIPGHKEAGMVGTLTVTAAETPRPTPFGSVSTGSGSTLIEAAIVNGKLEPSELWALTGDSVYLTILGDDERRELVIESVTSGMSIPPDAESRLYFTATTKPAAYRVLIDGVPSGTFSVREATTIEIGPKEILIQADMKFYGITTLSFKLDVHGDVFVDPSQSIRLLSAEGHLERPNRLATRLWLETSGRSISVDLVAIGNEIWLTDGLTGAWEPAPIDFPIFRPINVFGAGHNFELVRPFLEEAVLLPDDELQGRPVYRLRSHTQTHLEGPLNMLPLAGPASVDLWIDQDTFDVLRIEISGQSTSNTNAKVTWTIDIAEHDQPLRIDHPDDSGSLAIELADEVVTGGAGNPSNPTPELRAIDTEGTKVGIRDGKMDPERIEGNVGEPFVITVTGDGTAHTLAIESVVDAQDVASDGHTDV